MHSIPYVNHHNDLRTCQLADLLFSCDNRPQGHLLSRMSSDGSCESCKSIISSTRNTVVFSFPFL